MREGRGAGLGEPWIARCLSVASLYASVKLSGSCVLVRYGVDVGRGMRDSLDGESEAKSGRELVLGCLRCELLAILMVGYFSLASPVASVIYLALRVSNSSRERRRVALTVSARF